MHFIDIYSLTPMKIKGSSDKLLHKELHLSQTISIGHFHSTKIHKKKLPKSKLPPFYLPIIF